MVLSDLHTNFLKKTSFLFIWKVVFKGFLSDLGPIWFFEKNDVRKFLDEFTVSPLSNLQIFSKDPNLVQNLLKKWPKITQNRKISNCTETVQNHPKWFKNMFLPKSVFVYLVYFLCFPYNFILYFIQNLIYSATTHWVFEHLLKINSKQFNWFIFCHSTF